MTDRVPSIYFLVPGPWTSVDAIIDVLSREGIDAHATSDSPIVAGELRVDCVDDPAGFGKALERGRGGPLPSDIVAAANRCTHAALLEFGFRLQDAPVRVAQAGRALRDAGGVAVRVEASGSASPWEPWLDALDRGDAWGLVRSAVIVVDDDGNGVFTCGMHVFDLPEAEIQLSDPLEALEWVDELCVFQLAENPILGTGETFRPNASSPRRRLERWPDHRHPPEDGRHNPFGSWRLVRDDDSALRPMNPVLVITPSLVAQLVAAERKHGRPLAREEVESVANRSTAIAMSTKDAIALDRSRGYTDIEPRRAWAQWQLVRSRLV